MASLTTVCNSRFSNVVKDCELHDIVPMPTLGTTRLPIFVKELELDVGEEGVWIGEEGVLVSFLFRLS